MAVQVSPELKLQVTVAATAATHKRKNVRTVLFMGTLYDFATGNLLVEAVVWWAIHTVYGCCCQVI